MSDLKAKQQAIAEQAYHARAQRTIEQIEFVERRKGGAGLSVGYMLGGFGPSTQGGLGGVIFKLLPVFNLTIVGGWAIYLLATAL